MDYRGNMKISIKTTAVLKIAAISGIVVSHYYRFYASGTRLAFLGSIGFFGAALFAFLSGYGITKSCMTRGVGGRGYLAKKFKKVYAPFIFINLLSVLFVYREGVSESYAIRIFLGIDDGTMWYVPYIFVFYIAFYVFYRFLSNGRLSIVALEIGVVCAIQTLLFNYLHTGSQWYTSNGALVAGMLAALYDLRPKDNMKAICGLMFGLAVGVMVSRIVSTPPSMRELFITVSGVAFVILVFVVSWQIEIWVIKRKEKRREADKAYSDNIKRVFLGLGTLSFWIYMSHMKVAVFLEGVGILNLMTLCVFSLLASVGLQLVWNRIEKAWV